jgi:putative colanic acid biosynthesis glycosyltransferase
MQENGVRTKNISTLRNLDLPIVSIITVVFNGETTIAATIDSVLAQNYSSIEYIICDGESTDNTVKIIDNYSEKIDYWISEKDQGIYDAMNKGISLATGQWLLFLGSDDRLATPDSISNLVEATRDNTFHHNLPEVMLVCGKVKYDNGYVYSSQLSRSILISNTVHHQASLYSSKLFQDFRYSTICRVYSDYELNLAVFLQSHRTILIDDIIAICGNGGATAVHRNLATKELHYLRSRHIHWTRNALSSAIFYLWTMAIQTRTVLKNITNRKLAIEQSLH